jgi:hypothetical protein
MPKELKKLPNSKLSLLNTKKLVLLSLKPEDFSLITLKDLKVKPFSFKEERLLRTLKSMLKELL